MSSFFFHTLKNAKYFDGHYSDLFGVRKISWTINLDGKYRKYICHLFMLDKLANEYSPLMNLTRKSLDKKSKPAASLETTLRKHKPKNKKEKDLIAEFLERLG